MLLNGEDLLGQFVKRGYTRFAGVPCSGLQGILSAIARQEGSAYIAAANEGSALALACGFAMAGHRPAIFLQDSGFGNLLNPLTSLGNLFRIPCLLVISVHEPIDEPQHWQMSAAVEPILALLEIPFRRIDDVGPSFESDLDFLDQEVRRGRPAALLLRMGLVPPVRPSVLGSTRYTMSGFDVVREVLSRLDQDDSVISTTGQVSRYLLACRARTNNFFMVGSMGHAAAIGLGVALSTANDHCTVVLDGDGAALMHLGVLSTVGHCAPGNFLHVVVDNESYETTGGQPTSSATTSIDAAALACGYGSALRCECPEHLRDGIAQHRRSGGATLLLAKVRVTRDEYPSVLERHTPQTIAGPFVSRLRAAIARTATGAAITRHGMEAAGRLA